MLRSQLIDMEKARDTGVPDLDGPSREVRALKAHVRMMLDKLYSLKRRESRDCRPKATTRKVADAQGEITNLFTWLQQNRDGLYDAIRRKVLVH